MEERPRKRARTIALRILILVLVIGESVVMGVLVGWEGPVTVMLPILLLFGPLAVAVRSGHGALGKRPNGTRSWRAWLLFAQYLVASRFTFGVMRLFSREKAFLVVAPNLVFGRRLTNREAGQTDFVSVLDLASEFTEVRWFRQQPGYCSLPVFDTRAPTAEQLRFAVGWLREAIARGRVYVHCALGHGRSACVVLAYLLAEGKVATVAEGVRLLRERRPRVKLNPAQKAALRAFVSRSPEE